MVISGKELIGLPARTQSGFALGKVRDFEINMDTLEILSFSIIRSSLLNRILKENEGEIIVHKNQVVSFSKSEMVVFDGVIKNMKDKKIFKENPIENFSALARKFRTKK